MDKDERARLRTLCEKATDGPWFPKKCQEADDDRACGIDTEPGREGGEYRGIAYSDAYDECSHFMDADDAAFIASARNALPAALDYIDALEAVHDAAKGICDADYVSMSQWDTLRSALAAIAARKEPK